jgi:hypothetical protein
MGSFKRKMRDIFSLPDEFREFLCYVINAFMKIIILSVCCCLLLNFSSGQGTGKEGQIDTTNLDLGRFAKTIVSGVEGNFQKAEKLLNWLSHSFAWTATDYKSRTVNEILYRKGGNCFEMAKVYMALINTLNIDYRPIAEVNIHKTSDERGENSEKKIKESGNRMSVFGRQHNDHRWVEIYDERTGEWIPVDPTMNLIGYGQWEKARAWFGDRHTLNDEFSGDMIVPIAIFVVDKNDKTLMVEDRTRYYMVSKLDSLYENRLDKLPSWNKWVDGLDRINIHIKKAFLGEENLHNYSTDISELRANYFSLKKEYSESGYK